MKWKLQALQWIKREHEKLSRGFGHRSHSNLVPLIAC